MLLNSLLKVHRYDGNDITGRFSIGNVLDKSNKMPHVSRPLDMSGGGFSLVLEASAPFVLTHLLALKRTPL